MSTNRDLPPIAPLTQDPQPAPQAEFFPGERAELRTYFKQQKEAQQEAWAASMRTAIKTDPALYAQADKLALENGVTADFAMRNMDFLRGMSRMKQMRDEKIEETNPTWFRSMQSVEFARKAWDDDQLPWTEKWAKAWESGQLTTERGRLATRAMFTPGEMSQDDKDALEKVSQRLQEIGPVTGFFPSAIEIIGQQATSIPKAVGAGLALGGASAAVSAVAPPATPFTFLAGFKTGFYGTLATEYFQVEAGNAYADMMAAGYDPDRAWNAAFGIGVANAALGLGGFNLATGALRSEVGRLLTKKALAEAAEGTTSGFLRGFTKEYLKSAAGETVSEVMEELVTIAGESAARREGDVDLSPEGVASRLWEVASKTMQGMAVLGVPGGLAAGSRAQAIRLAKAQEALRIAGDLQDPMQRGAQSPLVKRDPATAETVVDQMLTEAKQPKTVFVDAATLRDALAQSDKATAEAAEGGALNNPPGQPIESALDKLERVVPGITEQIEDAASIGGDVQIPMAKLLSTIAAELPDVAKVLNENLRIDAAMPSAAEATQEQKEIEAQAKQADTGNAEFAQSSAKVRDDIVEKIRASATGLRYVEATTLARTISATIDVIAEKEGITPEQAWQKFGPSIQPMPEGQQVDLQQPTVKTDTPEFRAWFGDSKVVDEAGKPLVVYHGTKSPTEDMAFDFSKIGSNGRSEGAGFYFTTDQNIAAGYADGRLLETWLAIKKPMPLKQKGWAAPTLRKILKRAAELEAEADGSDIRDGFLSNFADTYGQGVSAAISEAARLVGADERAVDQMGGLVGAGLSPEHVNRAVVEVTGFDGIVSNGFGDEGGKGGTIYVAFLPEQIKSINNRGTFDPNDPNILRQPQRGGFLRRLMAVLFGEKSDASTVVHEMVHWYVEIIDRLAAQGSPWAQQQFQILLDRWKLTRPEWDAMADAQRAKLYEDISYNAEDYFATGNAPSKELEGVFQSIRSWIVRIYGQVRQLLGKAYQEEFGTELPPLTPELRGFFDRMLASEQAIEIVTAEREGATAFDPASAEKLGIDEATVAEIQRLGEESKQEAKDRLSSEAVRAARFYQAKRRGADRELDAKLQASKERIRAEVEKDVSARPVYAAQTFIKNGEVVNDKGETVSAKMDTDAVRRLLGDDEKLEAYYETKATAKQEAVRDAVSAAAEVAASRAPSIGAAVDANLATLEKERQAALERIEKAADFEVRSRPIYKAIDHISQGTVALDDGTEKPARLDRRAVREIAGKNRLGGAESLFDRIPSKYIRKEGQSPDVVARMFGFDNTLQFLEELAKANFERDVRAEVGRGKKESGLWSKDLASQASRMAAEETAASPAAARVAFQAGAKAARAQARIERPELVADLLREYTRKGGTNPSLMAAQFRFTSAEEMLRAFLNAPPMEQAIEAETVARLEAEEPLSDPKAMRQAVEAAMHGKAAARLSSTILRAMLGNPPGVTQAQLEGSAQQAARQVLLRMPVGQISVRAFSQAEHRAAKARLQAIKSGDRAAAIDAQRKHLLQHYLTRFSIDIEKELDRFAQTVTGSYLKSRDDILKAKRNLDMVQAIRVLLGRFGAIGQAQAEDANAYMATMAQQNPTGHAELATRIALAADGAKPWRETPLERWRIVMDEAAQLWHESKRSEQIKIQGKLLSKQAVQDEIEAQIIDTWGQSDKAPPEPSSYDPSTIIASLTRLEPWTVQADGGQMGGPLNRYVYRPLKEVLVSYEAEKSSEFRWYKEWLESHEGQLAGVPFDGQKWLGAGRGAVFENKAQILGLLAQLGTEGNRRNVFLGNGWATQKDGELYAHDGSPFMPKFQEMLAEMVARGILTKQDFDANQQALDHIRDNIKGRLFDTSREVYNFYPEAVEASPFDTPFGKYPGGYFPSQVDKKLSGVGDRQQIDSVASMKANFKANNTAPQRGMLIKRNEGAKEPRVLDIRLLWEHIDDSLKIIHMAGPLQDVANLFKGGTMVETLRKASPAALREIILPAIDRMARQATTAPSDARIRRFVASARQITSMIFLGLSPKNAAQQFTGLSNAAVYSSIPLVWGSFWKFWRNPAKTIAQIEAENPAMAVRWSDEMQALSMDVQQLLDPSRWKSVQQQATKWAFVLQRYAQMSTDAIAYMAAREKGVIDKLPDAEGIARAEAAVRLSQGEKTPLDVPRALSGHAVTQLFTQFADYPNVVLNANLAAPEGRRFAAFILTMVAPTLASSLIAIAFAGGQLGKGARSDDTDPEDIIAKLLGDQIKGAFSMAPGIGGAVGSGVVGIIDTIAEAAYGQDAPKLGGETQLRSSPFAAASLLDTFQRLSTGGANPRDFAALGTAITKLPLMPFGNAFSYMRRVDEGKSRPSGPVDYVRGLLTGR